MANILVVSLETSSAYTNTINAIKSLGHNVVGTVESVFPTLDLFSYDLIVSTRTEKNANTSKKLEQAVLNGIPVLCGSPRGGATGSESLVTHMRLANTVTEEGSSNNINYIVDSNKIFKNFTSGQSFKTHTSNSYMYGLTGFVESGEIITRINSTNVVSTVIFNAGTQTYSGITLPVKVAFCGFVYFQNDTYSAEVLPFLNDLISFLLEPSKEVSGFVKDTNKKGLVRQLYAYEVKTGRFVGSTISLEDGFYKMDVTTIEPVFVVCLPLTESHNAQVHTHIVPIDKEII